MKVEIEIRGKSKKGLEKMERELNWLLHKAEYSDKYLEKLKNWINSHRHNVSFLIGEKRFDGSDFLAFFIANNKGDQNE